MTDMTVRGSAMSLNSLVWTFEKAGILTTADQQRIDAVLENVWERGAPVSLRSLSKIERATASATLKMLFGVFQTAGILRPGDLSRIEHVILDAMARNAALQQLDREDRG